MDDSEKSAWDTIGDLKWQHIVLAVLAVAMVVGLAFAPDSGCSVSINSDTTTTTTTHPGH